MAFYTIFSHSIKISYKSKLLSESTIFYSLCVITNLLLPLLIIYKSDGMWRKIELYREQPDINFKHNLILILELKNSLTEFKFWSSFPLLNSAFRSDILCVPYISNREVDVNNDGKYDELNVDLNVPIDQNDDVVSAKLFLYFDYKLNTKVQLKMESIAYLGYSSVNPGKELRIIGELKLHQRESLLHRGLDLRFNDSLVVSQQFNIEDMLESYVRQNLSTILSSNSYYNWHLKRNNETQFKIRATVLYSEDTLFYRPGFWYQIKWLWIQYLAIFSIFYFIIKRILIFVFENRLLNCTLNCNSPLIMNKY